MLAALARALRYAKHVALFWNVGSLMSINISNTAECLLWRWLVGAAFGGIIFLGSGVEVQTDFWASDLHMQKESDD